MFARVKKSGKYQYLQIVKSRREGKKVVLQVVGTVGRMDQLNSKGEIDEVDPRNPTDLPPEKRDHQKPRIVQFPRTATVKRVGP